MPGKPELVSKTQTFFNRHWYGGDEPPSWSFEWAWTGPVPNYRLGGLYALLKDDELIYVGLGNSRGGGIYKERGISRRLESHVVDIAPAGSAVTYVPKQRWREAGVTQLATLGFPEEFSYLSPALEDFLIGELNPPQNSVRRRSPSLPTN